MEAYYSSLPGCSTVKKLLAAKAGYAQETDKTAVQQPESILADTDIIRVFQAKCHVDRPLQNPVQNPSYVYPIQVGADLTEQIISGLQDNQGENISRKNRNYCELTATYHAWKNCQAAYKGLCHYRRIFEIDDSQMRE
ncbi:MAG: DUF4422 domain-containing protein, partial [Lachnospiraceae bacterium]|nr:DUF4422 domain-containing protein [Lachnospiraceae bacterium]